MYFKKSDFFTGMAHGFVKDIMANVEKIACAAGDVIFREGDETNYFYILIKGHVKLRIGREGHTVFVINRAGECFGWSSLIGRDSYSASAKALEPGILTRIDSTKFLDIIKKDPVSEANIFKKLVGMLGDRLVGIYPSVA